MKNRQRFVRGIALFLAALMLFSLVFAALGSIFASAASSSDLDELEKEKEELAAQKVAAGNAAANLRQQKAAWVEQKEALDEKNRLAQEEILNTQKQIEIYNEMIAEKQAEAEAAQAAADEQLALYKKRLRSMEENGTYNLYMDVLFGAGSLDDLLSRVDMLTEIMENDKRIEQAYKDTRDAALAVKQEYEDLNAEAELKKQELEAEVEQLEKEIAEADEMINQLQSQIDEYMELYNAALAAEYAVQKKVNSIIAELKAAEEEAKRQQQQQQQGSTESGGESSGSTSNAPDTSTVTGSYIWPVPASRLVTSPFGNRVHPISGTVKFHKGIDIGAAAGSAILAADGGTVAYVGYDAGGYGNYVTVYHSNGRSTLYAHMSSVACSTGQTVSQGQTIGYVGSTGYSTGPHLHFEISIDGNLQNPLSYFSNYTPYWDES